MTVVESQANRTDSGTEWAVSADRIIDATGAPAITDAILIVRDGRIKEIGKRDKIKPPASVKVTHYPNETILPGLIDSHNHPTLKPIGTVFADYAGQFYDPDARITARSARNLRLDLLSGVTTIRVVGELNFVDVILEKEVHDGTIPGPNVIPSGPRLGPTGGHVW